MAVRYRVLGTLQVAAPDGRSAALGGYRQRLVLSLLLLHAGRPVSADELIDQVWGAEPPATARKTLQVYVSRLRRVLGNGDIASARGGYALHVESEDVDVGVFERLVSEGRRLLEAEPEAAAARLQEALALWRGGPWGELADEPALRADAERLRELRLMAVEDRIAADLARGSGAGQVAELHALVAGHPLRERLRGLLMTALYRQGRTADALTVFEEGRALLAEELGADPGPHLAAVHQKILRQHPDLLPVITDDAQLAASGPTPNPYKGLRAFGEEDAEVFFGRRELVDALRVRVDTSPLVLLLGPSGSGKSSVVRAGLVPALRAGGGQRPVVSMVPSAHPFAELEAALARDLGSRGDGGPVAFRGDDLDLLRAVLQVVPREDARLVLVIDQFEELFLQVIDEAERERFLRNLAEAVEDPHSRVAVLAVLRADLLDRPMVHARLGPLLKGALVQVLPLSPAELESACVRPAAQVGATVEPELVAELVAEVADQPAALPMFQYTLSTLFERRSGATMTLTDYRAVGGVRGVVAGRAEEVHGTLAAAAQAACRQVFLRLVTVGEEGEVGRRRALRDELTSLAVDSAAVAEVLERFAAARLLAFDRDATDGQATVQVAHEALLREWPRLAGWIEESRIDLRVHRWVSPAAAEWDASGRQDTYLLSGARLDIAADWRTRAAASATETAFVDAGLDLRRREQEAEEDRRRRELELERRASGRLRQLVAVLTVAALAATVLGAWALAQRRNAVEQAATARVATELGRARTLANAAVANRRVDPERSLLLSLHAADIMAQSGEPVPREIVEALHWSLQAAGVPYPADATVTAALGPEGRQGLFDLPIDRLYALARSHVGRGLTAEECGSYFAAGRCPPLPASLDGAQTVPVAASASGESTLEGTRVTIAGTFFGETREVLLQEFAHFSQQTGIEVVYEAPADLEPWLGLSLTDNRPPDIAFVPQPGQIMELARAGQALDLSTYLDPAELRGRFSPHLIDLVTAESGGGAVYGVPVKLADKSLLWYAPEAIASGGYELPTTYDELLAVTGQMVDDGHTPWCHGESIGSAAGWPGTDVVEKLLLHASVDDYDAWLGHDIGFDDPPLRRAFEQMRALLFAPGHVVGGPQAAATRDIDFSAAPLFHDPPNCVFFAQASFLPMFFPAGVRIGRDIGVMPFPQVDPVSSPAVLGSGDFAVVFADRPEVRALLLHFVVGDFGQVWAGTERTFMSPRSDFPVEAYNCDDPESESVMCATGFGGTLGDRLTDALAADRFRFDGSDLLPKDVSDAMWAHMVDFAAAEGENLDEVLADLEATWVETEQGAAAGVGR